MPIHPGMVEDLAAGTRDLYASAEERLLGIIARQLADGMDAPQWADRKLSAVQALRRGAQGVVDQLDQAVTTEVFDVVAEAYNTGHRAGVAEIGAMDDDARRLVDEITPQAQALDRLAEQTVTRVTDTHRSILRTIVDRFRDIVSRVAALPILGTATRRQATQEAMQKWADEGITSFVGRDGRRWSLTSYAEMAVRTAVGRAAVEGHMRTLETAGIELVVVSNSPRECPKCRPWERRILALSGPDGARTVEVEHATDDGVMVPVRVAGTLDEARRADFQHPNCRHSVSAYTPGITRVEDAEPDPEGYKAGQRQREIERTIRRYKNRAAAATSPEEKRAAEAKTRQWQGHMRDHLAAHPDLRRLRHREQPGASNLPEPRTAPPAPEFAQAARIRSGDSLTPREMTDEQLGAAMRAPSMDERDRARVEVEADRRDTEQLLDRARPGGQLTDDLLSLSDDDLARLVSHTTGPDAMRVMGEMDRRDRAGQLPTVRADLVGLSDDQLAARYRTAPDDQAATIAEAHRRDLLARTFPGGRLADDLTAIGDDTLAWAMPYATTDEILRIAGEMDRREPVAMPTPAATGDPIADLITDSRALDDAMSPLPEPDDPHAWLDSEDFTRALAAQIKADEEAGRGEEDDQPTMTRAQARALYDEYVYEQYLAAELATNGYLMTKAAYAAGHSDVGLFSGPARIAYARASDELKEWWDEHPRLTQAEFISQATGQEQRWARGARENAATHKGKR
ncbi:phage minor capsid protein [Streptomyces sp. NPDC056500]|uniref:phage minor capsid protein n=1 Tax=Streptomyces sp. NPDC056500 TaxID=3345840 RepID=UPI0036A03049